MQPVKLLLEETFAGGAVFLDLFNKVLDIDDSTDPSKVTAKPKLSTTHFDITFEEDADFPSLGKDVDVPVTISLLGGKLAAFNNISAKLRIHRDSAKRATVRQVLELQQTVNFDWPGLTIQHCVAKPKVIEKVIAVTRLQIRS